jgi:hypothetical protein
MNNQPRKAARATTVAAALMMLTLATGHAQQAPAAKPAARKPAPRAPAPTREDYETLKRQVEEQNQLLQNMRQALGEQDARYKELQATIQAQERAQQQARQDAQQREQQQAQAKAAQEAPRTVQIGTAPSGGADVSTVAPRLFEEPGVLTPKGQTIFEPSISYGYSSSNRAALVGYTVVPALLIGLVDVREVRRNTLTAAVALRHGISNRFEVEAKLPYVYRSDTTVSREIFTGSATDAAFGATGHGIGDFEVTGRYQITDGGNDKPYLIGSLRFKSRTGKDPFEVVTDCVTRCVSNTTGTGEPLELPTGSGFYTVQPGITWLIPSDPAVFFGSFSYGYNVARDNVSRHVLGGQTESLGRVKAGDVIGMNVGMGLAINDRSSFSIGIDLSSIGKTKQNGIPVPGSVRTQLATLMLGYSHRISDKRTLNLSVGAGLTRDTPDLTVTVRVPFTL